MCESEIGGLTEEIFDSTEIWLQESCPITLRVTEKDGDFGPVTAFANTASIVVLERFRFLQATVRMRVNPRKHI
jgi:hypothetical protein